ncbi:PAS domain-containing hybrid sensor histidine kinase/response regulator [Chitinimonas sp. BJYL2]|uniref:hybrid sensor histidine kinase/response regulator n=1 Tax=Chitinimonas sp. BJYL2 TaxID=2976696 RepID=UPI0022B381CE|nr:PAS domain-containing hybrid sensor histidine kinase/response regulator [Chitinimonas sp. BJYL2]
MTPLAWSNLAAYAWLPAPTWVYQPDRHCIRWANEAALALWLADDLEELCSRDLSALSPAVAMRLDDLVRRIERDGVTRADWTLYPRGQPVQVGLTAVAITLPEGGLGLCFQAVPHAQQTIDAATLRGVEAVLHFSLAVVMFDLEGRVLMRNPAAARVFPQLAREEIADFASLFDSPEVAAQVWQRARDQGLDQAERQFSGAQGRRWHAYTLHRVIDPVSGEMAMLFAAQDVTERVLSEQKFRVLFEQSATAMLLFDPATMRVVDCNRASAQALRLASRRQLIESPPERFYPRLQPDGRESLPQADEAVARALKTGWHRFEWLLIRADQSELLVEVTLSPVQLDDRQLLLAMWYDLSLRRLIERQLLEAKQVAEMASRTKSQFLANMSHEIRTPLNAIIGATGLLLDSERDEARLRWLNMIKFSSQGLIELVGDILDFSRVEAGKLSVESRPFDLRALVARTSELLRFSAEQKQLTLQLGMDASLPRWVYGDESRLRQVLINLLGNAIKFTEQGRVSLHLGVLSSLPDRVEVEVVVSDTGIGIEAEQIQHIFEPFAQADDSVSRRYGGSGLGLTISQRLIEAMGGQLGVQSTPGVGSEFRFSLPLLLAESQDEVADAQATPDRALRILLAEDNALNQELACALLTRDGHEVVVANHGGEAVDLYSLGEFDLILMDIQMPGMDGLTATRIIRALEGERRVPIVAMTANAQPEDREASLGAGMDDFLTKPISDAKLRDLLTRLAASPVQTSQSVDEATASSPLFDVDGALDVCGGNARLLDQLLGLFCEEWPARQAALRRALQAGDAAQLQELAHTLKGSFGALAGSPGQQAAWRLEQAARAGQVDAAACEALCALGEQFVALVRQRLDRSAHAA